MATEKVEIKDPVAEFLATLGITYVAQYGGEGKRKAEAPNERDWVHDKWLCQFTRGVHDINCSVRSFKPRSRGSAMCSCVAQRKGVFVTEFSAGTGHRRTADITGRSYMTTMSNPARTYWQGAKQYAEFIQSPLAGEVLSSVFLDTQAAEMSFSSWCDDFGFNSDSMKDFATYQHCEKVARDMRTFFGADLSKIKDFMEGYES